MKKIISLAIILILVVLGIIVLNTSASKYAILIFTLAFVMFIALAYSYINDKDKDGAKVYEKTIRKILNTYDSILVRSNGVPSLEGKSIISLLSIEDLVDAQLEIRKPICYIKQTESTSFILIDEKEAYVHTIKLYENSVSPLDIEINNINIKHKKNNEDIDMALLSDIEKTTFIILPNRKSFKVSPLNENKKQNIQKEEIEVI